MPDLPRSQFYGRRTGRKLHKARAAALELALPRYEIRLRDLPDLSSRCLTTGSNIFGNTFLDPATKSRDDGSRNVWLEIGFGNGEHLLAQASRHPEISFIGCEPFVNGVSALVRSLEEKAIANVRVFPEDARLLLKTLPDGSIARCFVLFADPWPKTRHNKRRIVNPETLDDLARVLTPEGEIYLATDDPGLAAWYKEVVAAHSAFTLRAASGKDPRARPPDWPATRYEEKALAAGRAPVYLIANCASPA